LGREVPSCSACGSTVRLRSLIALLSREVFGVELAIPDFPVLKGIRGFGMSDAPELAQRLAEKFDYTNTFYHQEPRLDIADPTPEHLAENTGRYDFILSSEVLEHVSPPVERAFANLNRMLKPAGLLVLTVPYRIDGHTAEHFPELHEYSLASPGGRTVLVNRRRDGSLEVYENLSFHGGAGSTLEMRVFTETSLKEISPRRVSPACTSLPRTYRSLACSTVRLGRSPWQAGKDPFSRLPLRSRRLTDTPHGNAPPSRAN
jgi:SAM-dependent methyltransferase